MSVPRYILVVLLSMVVHSSLITPIIFDPMFLIIAVLYVHTALPLSTFASLAGSTGCSMFECLQRVDTSKCKITGVKVSCPMISMIPNPGRILWITIHSS